MKNEPLDQLAIIAGLKPLSNWQVSPEDGLPQVIEKNYIFKDFILH